MNWFTSGSIKVLWRAKDSILVRLIPNDSAACFLFVELGKNPVVDIYGTFEPERKMFVDKGWLINETEIQLRFYKDPIHMFKVLSSDKECIGPQETKHTNQV